MSKPKAIQYKHPQSWPSFNPINHGSDNFIGAGTNNTISGNYNAILGGQGNCVSSSFSHAGVFGCNVTANLSCAFHANNFVGHDLPTLGGGPSGSFWKTNIGGVCVVAINP